MVWDFPGQAPCHGDTRGETPGESGVTRSAGGVREGWLASILGEPRPGQRGGSRCPLPQPTPREPAHQAVPRPGPTPGLSELNRSALSRHLCPRAFAQAIPLTRGLLSKLHSPQAQGGAGREWTRVPARVKVSDHQYRPLGFAGREQRPEGPLSGLRHVWVVPALGRLE